VHVPEGGWHGDCDGIRYSVGIRLVHMILIHAATVML